MFGGGELPHVGPEAFGGALLEEDAAAAEDGEDVVVDFGGGFTFGGDGDVGDAVGLEGFALF